MNHYISTMQILRFFVVWFCLCVIVCLFGVGWFVCFVVFFCVFCLFGFFCCFCFVLTYILVSVICLNIH